MDSDWQRILDRRAFERTTELFERKREALPLDVVERLASLVMDFASRLAANTDTPRAYEAPPDRLRAFCEMLLAGDADGALELMQSERLDGGLSARDVYSGYISASAQRLGRMWERDEASFVEVTAATGHLYALMRALRPEAQEKTRGSDLRKTALFATVPGEAHSLGVTMAADIFRRAGWSIDLQRGLNHNELVSHIADCQPELVGLSISGDGRLDALATLCVSIRLNLPHALIVVAGQAAGQGNTIAELADVDFVFDNVDDAEHQLARLMKMRG